MTQPRDLETQPYSKDEQRVADWLSSQSPDIGTGDDPIGFVLASFSMVLAQRKLTTAALLTVRNVCGQNHMNCPGASKVKAKIAALDELA